MVHCLSRSNYCVVFLTLTNSDEPPCLFSFLLSWTSGNDHTAKPQYSPTPSSQNGYSLKDKWNMCCWEGGEKKEPFILFTAMHINIVTMENWDIPKGIKNGLPESLLLGIYAKQRDICDNHQAMPSGEMSIKQ